MCVDGTCHHYPSLLGAATAFDVFGLFAVFALSITTCCSLCCPANLGASGDMNNGENPTVIVVGQAPNPYNQTNYSAQNYAPAAYVPAAYTPTPAYAATGQQQQYPGYNGGGAPPVVVYAVPSQPSGEQGKMYQ